jgi:cell division cycle 20-like protein 1, cofactor of APC complex
MQSSVAGSSSKPPTPASTPNSRLASAHSSRASPTPPHPSAPSPAASPASRTVYSDRFIPSRAGSNLALFDLAPSPSPRGAAHSGSASPYCALLREALFGPDTPDRAGSSATSSAAASPIGTPATGNIFRFKTEVPRNAKRALFSASDDGDALCPGVFASRGAVPRKIARSPYKVTRGTLFLDCPSVS